jgi:hypothetical protein
MPAPSRQKSDVESIVEILHRHGVEYVVIGGQAEILHGGGRITFDTDLCYRREAKNMERLAAALREIKPSLRGAPADLPFQIDAQSLALGCNFTFTTPFGDLDFLGEVEPIGNYERLIKAATRFRVGEVDVNVIHIDDLIRVKRYVNRPKDRDSLFQLKAIKEARGEPWPEA